MNIAKYCKDKGMTLEQYKTFTQNIKTTAKTIRQQLTYKGGQYYSTNDIISYNSDADMKNFIIQELKQLGIEFFDNNTLYRVTE